MTVIISEHRLEEVLPLADRVLLLEEGGLRFQGPPRDLVREAGKEPQSAHQAYLPTASRLYLALATDLVPDVVSAPLETTPLTVREGKRWLHSVAGRASAAGFTRKPQPPVSLNTASTASQPAIDCHGSVPAASSEPLLSCREVTFRYEKDGAEVLKKLSLSLYRGELLAVMGGNGAGKSTLLHAWCAHFENRYDKVDACDQSPDTGNLQRQRVVVVTDRRTELQTRQREISRPTGIRRSSDDEGNVQQHELKFNYFH